MDKTFRPPPGQSKQPKPSLENSSEVAPPGQGRGAREVAAGDPSYGNPANTGGRRIADNHTYQPGVPSAFCGPQSLAGESSKQPGDLPDEAELSAALPSIAGLTQSCATRQETLSCVVRCIEHPHGCVDSTAPKEKEKAHTVVVLEAEGSSSSTCLLWVGLTKV